MCHPLGGQACVLVLVVSFLVSLSLVSSIFLHIHVQHDKLRRLKLDLQVSVEHTSIQCLKPKFWLTGTTRIEAESAVQLQ